MWEMIASGGWTLGVIVVVSLVAIALIVERLLVYTRARTAMEPLAEQVGKCIREGDLQSALTACRSVSGAVPDIYAMAIEHELAGSSASPDDLTETVTVYVRTVSIPNLRRFLRTIALIGRSAPMLGLLGTVFGMIVLFTDMSKKGMGDPATYTHGVGLAFVNTAAGLLLAIAVIYLHGYLVNNVELIENEIDHYVPRLLGWLRQYRLTAGARQ